MLNKKNVLSVLLCSFLSLCFNSCKYFVPTETEKENVENVQFSPEGGTYKGNIEVSFTCKTPGVDFYYSVDKPLYKTNYTTGIKADSVTLDKSCTLYAIAVLPSGNTSVSARQNYVIEPVAPDEIIVNYLTDSDLDPSYSVINSYEENTALYLGNPTKATSNAEFKNNYLIEYSSFALSYNNEKAMPNWVSWHLVQSDRGNVDRSDSTAAQNAGRPGFHPDTNLPEGFTRIIYDDYTGSGFDRGHQCPSADRTSTTDANDETYVMTNMCPQSSPMNGGTWGSLEDYERDLLDGQNCELYIYAGPAGIGGTGRDGVTYYETYQKDSNHNKITIPKFSWKIILVMDKGSDDISRITTSTRVLAALIPNTPECLNKGWNEYRVSVDYIEEITGYDFFSELPDEIENVLEAKVDDVEISKENLYSVYYPSPVEFSIDGTLLEAGGTYKVTAGTKVHLRGYPATSSVRIYYGNVSRNICKDDEQPSGTSYLVTSKANESSDYDISINTSQTLYAQVTKSTKDSEGVYKISSTSKESYVKFIVE